MKVIQSVINIVTCSFCLLNKIMLILSFEIFKFYLYINLKRWKDIIIFIRYSNNDIKIKNYQINVIKIIYSKSFKIYITYNNFLT